MLLNTNALRGDSLRESYGEMKIYLPIKSPSSNPYYEDISGTHITKSNGGKIPPISTYDLYSKNTLDTSNTSKDVIYFCKTSITSRDKIKQYYLNNNFVFNRTNRIEQANCFVFNYNDLLLISQFTYSEYIKIKTTDLEAYIDSRYIIPELQKYEYIYFSEHDCSTSALDVRKIKWEKVNELIYFPKDLKSLYFIQALDKTLIKVALGEAKIVYDQALTTLINETELDINMFKSLYSMLNSNNSHDVKMAIEIIGGVDPFKYKLPILLLVNLFWQKIGEHRYNILNFKLLMEHFKKYKYNYDPWDKFVPALITAEKSKFTNNDYEIINEYMKLTLTRLMSNSVSITDIKTIIN